jgi:hypothetical protein
MVLPDQVCAAEGFRSMDGLTRSRSKAEENSTNCRSRPLAARIVTRSPVPGLENSLKKRNFDAVAGAPSPHRSSISEHG